MASGTYIRTPEHRSKMSDIQKTNPSSYERSPQLRAATSARLAGHEVSGETRDKIAVLKTTHGMSYTRTYKSWSSMIQRVRNPNHQAFARYGGRGITVCTRWLSFDAFYDDMGDRPEGTSLDRLNNDKGYEPGNCRWATASEQQHNRHDNRVTLPGQK